jgi:hypothetical protein
MAGASTRGGGAPVKILVWTVGLSRMQFYDMAVTPKNWVVAFAKICQSTTIVWVVMQKI